MHVALICPFSAGPVRGNITTVRRIAKYLTEAGCQVTELFLDKSAFGEQRDILHRTRPDLLHAFHAFHSGPISRELAMQTGIPYLITFTGSDAFDPAMNRDRATRQAISSATTVTCFDPSVAGFIKDVFPETINKLTIVPQGVAPLSPPETFSRVANGFTILLPAALRPVKGITDALEALIPLAGELPSLRLLLAGGALEPDYAATIQERCASLPWVHLLGEIPNDRMGELYAAADLVLNCSLFEGGMANTLLEAMSMGKPVLARDVLGNRNLIQHEKTGWLYKTDHDLRELVRMLIRNPERGIKMGEAGRVFVQKYCSPVTEARNYIRAYERILKFPGSSKRTAASTT